MTAKTASRKEKRTLASQGIVQTNLFRVSGELVSHYNHALEQIIGQQTKLSTFHVDKRGESPEIEAELGENYLQLGSSNRFMIIVSPSQKDAGLIHEEFSYDHGLFDFLYLNNLTGIGLVTRVDAMFGELANGIRAYHSVEDLLRLKEVHINLHTPSDFVQKANYLQELVTQLEGDASLLTANDEEVPKKIHELVNQVGDVRNHNFADIAISKEIGSFYSRLFDGVYVFRNVGEKHKKNPEKYVQKSSKDPLFDEVLQRFGPWGAQQVGLIEEFFDKSGLTMSNPKKKSKNKKKKGRKDSEDYTPSTVVIYANGQDHSPENSRSISYIPFQKTDEVVEFLTENGYARFSPSLIDERLHRLEDLTLLSMQYDVAKMSELRRRAKVDEKRDELPQEWYALMGVQRYCDLDHPFQEVVQSSDPFVQAMLLVPTEGDHKHIVQNLLTRLWPHDYKQMVHHNVRDLERFFERTTIKKQDYIIKTLQTR